MYIHCHNVFHSRFTARSLQRNARGLFLFSFHFPRHVFDITHTDHKLWLILERFAAFSKMNSLPPPMIYQRHEFFIPRHECAASHLTAPRNEVRELIAFSLFRGLLSVELNYLTAPGCNWVAPGMQQQPETWYFHIKVNKLEKTSRKRWNIHRRAKVIFNKISSASKSTANKAALILSQYMYTEGRYWF